MSARSNGGQQTSQTKVAFLGLGIMGTGMAGRLVDAGFQVSVFNRTPEKAADLVKRGARLAKSPRDAADGADFIVTMVADDEASRKLWLGENGALTGAKKGAVLIDTSTVTPEWIRELGDAAQKHGCDLIDAPVTGSKTQAAGGELNFLAGGSEEAIERARPILSVMSRAIVHAGPLGSGAVLKLVNNFLCGAQIAALAEAMVFVERSGLNIDTAMQVLTNGAPGSPLVKTMSARMMLRDFAPNFHLELMAKDLKYAQGEAKRHGVALNTASPAIERFEQAAKSGRASQDFSAVVEPIREQR